MANRGERRPSFWDTRLAADPFGATEENKNQTVLNDAEISERIRQGVRTFSKLFSPFQMVSCTMEAGLTPEANPSEIASRTCRFHTG